MSLHVTATPQQPAAPARQYPYLGKCVDSDAIVLFHAPKKGICVRASHRSPVGKYSEKWKETDFNLYEGTVTLTSTHP